MTRERPMRCRAQPVRAILDGRKTMTREIVATSLEIIKTLSTEEWARGLANAAGVMFRQCLSEEDIQRKGEQMKGRWHPVQAKNNSGEYRTALECPFGVPGDRLWLRETFWQDRRDPTCVVMDADGMCINRADAPRADHLMRIDTGNLRVNKHWCRRSPIHMPRWACRITLEITGVRLERLNAISEDDAEAEGMEPLPLQAGEPGCWYSSDVDAGPKFHARSARLAFRKLWESLHGSGSWAANPLVWVIEFRRVET